MRWANTKNVQNNNNNNRIRDSLTDVPIVTDNDTNFVVETRAHYPLKPLFVTQRARPGNKDTKSSLSPDAIISRENKQDNRARKWRALRPPQLSNWAHPVRKVTHRAKRQRSFENRSNPFILLYAAANSRHDTMEP